MIRKALTVSAALLLLTASAQAVPLLMDGTYTSYLGESNYLYLEDAEGGQKVLRSAIADIVGMRDDRLYCLTPEGRLYAIRLDGTGTSIVSAAPTEEDLLACASPAAYTLSEDGLLSLQTEEDSLPTAIAKGVEAACANGDTVVYAADGALYRLPAGDAAAQPELLTAYDGEAMSLFASRDSAALTLTDGTVLVCSLTDPAAGATVLPADGTAVHAAAAVNGQVFRYTMDESGYTVVDASGTDEPMENAVSAAEPAQPADESANASMLTAEPAATATPTAVPTVAPTAAPTTVPTAAPTAVPVTSEPSSVTGSVCYGDRGSAVLAMQQRLEALGYPVGGADGIYGDNTLTAVKLFQGDIGYRERSEVIPAVLEKLYAADAPVYDAYQPLEQGDSGIRVTLMQTALQKLGYTTGGADGDYGAKTTKAVTAFQKAKGLTVTGQADRNTLTLLYTLKPATAKTSSGSGKKTSVTAIPPELLPNAGEPTATPASDADESTNESASGQTEDASSSVEESTAQEEIPPAPPVSAEENTGAAE